MNRKNIKIKSILIMFLSLLMMAAFSFAGVNFFFSYSDYDYAPYQENFGIGYYDYNTILGPYGYWIRVEPVGIVWVPYVYISWRPYYYGYWVYTYYGPTWVAYEPWGWLTHHYGRWFYYPVYGWCWMPGYEWAPAWVSWRIYGEYIAWAPLPPEGYYYDSRYEYDKYNGYRQNSLKFNPYVAVNVKDFPKENIHKYIKTNLKIEDMKFASEKVPDKEFIEKHTFYRVPLVSLEEKSFRINGRQLNYYSPTGQAEKVITHSEEIRKNLRPVKLTTEEEKKFYIKEGKVVKDDYRIYPKLDRGDLYNNSSGSKARYRQNEYDYNEVKKPNWRERNIQNNHIERKDEMKNFNKSDVYFKEFFKERDNRNEYEKANLYYQRKNDMQYQDAPTVNIRNREIADDNSPIFKPALKNKNYFHQERNFKDKQSKRFDRD